MNNSHTQKKNQRQKTIYQRNLPDKSNNIFNNLKKLIPAVLC